MIGYRSGKDNVTGTANTFFGYQSWELNTTSDSNTFVGWSRSRQRYAQCVCRLIRDPVGDLIDSTMHVHIIGE